MAGEKKGKWMENKIFKGGHTNSMGPNLCSHFFVVFQVEIRVVLLSLSHSCNSAKKLQASFEILQIPVILQLETCIMSAWYSPSNHLLTKRFIISHSFLLHCRKSIIFNHIIIIIQIPQPTCFVHQPRHNHRDKTHSPHQVEPLLHLLREQVSQLAGACKTSLQGVIEMMMESCCYVLLPQQNSTTFVTKITCHHSWK